MQAGRLNRRIELQSSTSSADTFGEMIKTWSTYATVWAAVLPFSGREMIYANQISSQQNIRIFIRYNSAVKVGDRIKYGTRYFDINTVINTTEKREQIELLCKESE